MTNPLDDVNLAIVGPWWIARGSRSLAALRVASTEAGAATTRQIELSQACGA